MILQVKRLREDAVLPVRATAGSAGMDLHALVDAPVTLQPGQRAMIPTGLAIALPSPDYVALVFARSGLAVKKGITLANCVGVVDSDYRGELKVGLVNQSQEPYTVEKGERIAQLAVLPVCLPEIVETESLDETGRGAGGFGSTGK